MTFYETKYMIMTTTKKKKSFYYLSTLNASLYKVLVKCFDQYGTVLFNRTSHLSQNIWADNRIQILEVHVHQWCNRAFLREDHLQFWLTLWLEISMNKIEIFTVVICLRRHIRRDDLLMFSPPDLMGQNKNGSEELNNEHLWINSSMQISSF